MVQQCSQKVQYSWHGIANKQIKHNITKCIRITRWIY